MSSQIAILFYLKTNIDLVCKGAAMEEVKQRFPLKLVGLTGEHQGKEIVLDRERSSIGTKKGFHVRLTQDGKVKGFHAVIEKREGSYVLTPKQGTTWVDGRAIKGPVLLEHGHHLRVGDTEFLVQKHWHPLFTDEEANNFFKKIAGENHQIFPIQLKRKIYSNLLFEQATKLNLIYGTPVREIGLAAKNAAEIIEKLEKAGLKGLGEKIVGTAVKRAQKALTASGSVEALQRLAFASNQLHLVLRQAEKYTYSDLKKNYSITQISKIADSLNQDIQEADPQKTIEAIQSTGLNFDVKVRPHGELVLVLYSPIRRRDVKKLENEIGWKVSRQEYAERTATDVVTHLFSSALDPNHFEWGREHPHPKKLQIAFFPRSIEAEHLLERIALSIEKKQKK